VLSPVASVLSTSRLARLAAVMVAAVSVGFAVGAAAQTVDARLWQGSTAMTRQPEQVHAVTMAEWRSLWSRVGVRAPDHFEPGRTSAVGIFLGARNGMGYSVNVLSTVRRRDRIMVVFQEGVPRNMATAQALQAPPPAPAQRPVSGGMGFASPGGNPGFAPQGGPQGFGPPTGSMASLTPARPTGPVSSPWAIVLINRTDLPVSVEQRLF
jgi:hypothetical protein